MLEKTIKIPGPDHPITIAPSASRVVVTKGGKTLADTTAALTLREARYPPVHYIPRADVDMALLQRSESQSYCPYKGDASYFGIAEGEAPAIDIVWSYEAPFPAVAEIKDYLAFYADRVDAIAEL